MKKIIYSLVIFGMMAVVFTKTRSTQIKNNEIQSIESTQDDEAVSSLTQSTASKNVMTEKTNNNSVNLKVNDPTTKDKEAERKHLVQKVRYLSMKYFLTKSEKEDLQSTLKNKQTLDTVREALNNPELLRSTFLRDRLHALDVLYEALKNGNDENQKSYREIAFEALSKDFPRNVAPDSFESKQYFGDRVEMIVTMKALKNRSLDQAIENLGQKSEAAQKYIQKANQVKDLYEVSL